MTDTVPADGLRKPRRLLGIGPRSMPLSAVLALAIGTLVLVAVAATLIVAVLASTRNTISLLEDRAGLILDLAEARLRDHVDEVAIELRELAREMESGGIDPVNIVGMDYALRAAMAATPQVVALGIWRPDLNGTVGIRDEAGINVNRYQESTDAELLLNAMERAALNPDGYWGELVFIPELGATIVNRRQPVFGDGDLVGMLVAGVSVRELSNLMARISEDEDEEDFDSASANEDDYEDGDDQPAEAKAFIIYGDDDILAHPELADVPADSALAEALRGRSQSQPLLTIDQLADPVLMGMLEGTAEEPPILGAENSADLSIRFVEIDDDDVLVLTRQLSQYGPSPLVIGTYFPAAAVASEIERLIGSAMIGIGIMVIAVLLGIWMGRRLARPVIRLANRASQVSETLDFGTVEPLPGSAIRELNRQAEAFNTMTAGMRWMDTYLPKSLVRRLVRKDLNEQVVSISRELTVMFTDIKGFTAQSEDLPADQVAAFLNDHFTLLGGCIEAEEGTIDKFIGDALMAFWSAPLRQKDHADRACRAALAIRARVEADNAARTARGETPIIIRVGLHSGSVVVGNIGAPSRMNYTIVGDTVNIGHRLEALGKEVPAHPSGVTILISGATARLLTPNVFRLDDAGKHQVRGRTARLDVLRLEGYLDGAGLSEAEA